MCNGLLLYLCVNTWVDCNYSFWVELLICVCLLFELFALYFSISSWDTCVAILDFVIYLLVLFANYCKNVRSAFVCYVTLTSWLLWRRWVASKGWYSTEVKISQWFFLLSRHSCLVHSQEKKTDWISLLSKCAFCVLVFFLFYSFLVLKTIFSFSFDSRRVWWQFLVLSFLDFVSV